MRLANEICAAAMEHVRGELRPGMKESEAAAIWQGFVHGEGTGWQGKVELALGFSLVWSGRGHQDVHRDRRPPGCRGRADAVRDLGRAPTATGPTTRSSSAPASCGRTTASSRQRLLDVYSRAIDHCKPGASLAELDRLVRDGHRRARLRGPADAPDLPRRRRARARAAVRRTRRAAATVAEGMVLAIEPGCYWEGGGGLRVEDNFLITADGAEKLSPFPDGVVRCRRPDLDRLAERRVRASAGTSACTTRRCATASRPSASCSTRSRSSRSRGCSTSSASTGSRPASRASRTTTGRRSSRSRPPACAPRSGASRAPCRPTSRRSSSSASRYSVIESPISDLKLDAIGVSREKMLDRITSAMRFAAEHGIHAAFFGVDSTRAERDFYDAVYDDGGRGGRARRSSSSTRSASRRRRRSTELVGAHGRGSSTCPCTSTATTTSASRRRAPSPPCARARRYVHGTINGMGERAGNANLGEVALTLRALYGVETNLRLDRIREVSERVRELSGYELEPWKPVTGETLYRRESGRGRVAVPRPAVDRAVLVGARRDRARDRARQEERARLDPHQGGGARPRRAGGAARARCSPR